MERLSNKRLSSIGTSKSTGSVTGILKRRASQHPSSPHEQNMKQIEYTLQMCSAMSRDGLLRHSLKFLQGLQNSIEEYAKENSLIKRIKNLDTAQFHENVTYAVTVKTKQSQLKEKILKQLNWQKFKIKMAIADLNKLAKQSKSKLDVLHTDLYNYKEEYQVKPWVETLYQIIKRYLTLKNIEEGLNNRITQNHTINNDEIFLQHTINLIQIYKTPPNNTNLKVYEQYYEKKDYTNILIKLQTQLAQLQIKNKSKTKKQ